MGEVGPGLGVALVVLLIVAILVMAVSFSFGMFGLAPLIQRLLDRSEDDDEESP
jgi:hypothetical protein